MIQSHKCEGLVRGDITLAVACIDVESYEWDRCRNGAHSFSAREDITRFPILGLSFIEGFLADYRREVSHFLDGYQRFCSELYVCQNRLEVLRLILSEAVAN